MWTCAKCGERIEEQFDSCWKCSTPRGEAAAEAPAVEADSPGWRMAFKVFRGTFASWESLFQQAADFATEVGPERVLNISHSEDDSDGVVTVWYWESKDQRERGGPG